MAAIGHVICAFAAGPALAASLPAPVFPAAGAAEAPLASTPVQTTTLYMPMVLNPGAFRRDIPIWAHTSNPSDHEVVLFRAHFTSDDELHSAELHIFADTRYEVWLDGAWIGRGPARFSRVTREYDIYDLGVLQPGPHVIAALVQWAPNGRRSESTTPGLQAHVQGMVAGQFRTLAHTGATWKARLSNGWQADAAPVGSVLIGPTELADLRLIPASWMLPGFSDGGWPAAQVKPWPEEATYAPRSIPLLENVPFTPTVVDAGLLASGRAIVEVAPTTTNPYQFGFDALGATAFTVEILSGSLQSQSGSVTLDGSPLQWVQADASRPDVYIASVQVASGAHVLAFPNVPAYGLTFSIPVDSIRPHAPTFQQGAHAGRRLLLAEPDSDDSHVGISVAQGGLNAHLTSLPAYLVLDLGRTVHGRLVAQVSGISGTVVDIGWAERLWQDHRPLPHPGSLHAGWNQTDSWVLDGTTRTISTIDARAGRYVLIAAWGDAPVSITGIRVYEERYPLVQQGSFASSDPLMDRIWQVGVDSLYPNMTDAYTDTPWRERGQWWGDAYAEDRINVVAFGDAGLLRRGLSFMAGGFTADGHPPAFAPNWDRSTDLLDFGMLWVQSLADYWQRTGDVQLLSQIYPTLQRFMTHLASYENGTTGLIDVPYGAWYETALIDWAGETSRYGQSTALNALYYGTLQDAADVADALGDSARGSAWRAKADLIKQRINTYLYLPAERRYVASIVGGQPRSPTPHAQAWPLAYDVVPVGEVDGVTDSLLQLLSPDPALPNVEIFGMTWVLEALGRGGRVTEALDLIESAYGRLLDLGATTWWEGFRSDSRFDSSLSHGWGGAPTWFLSTYVLGARRTGPDTWLMTPALAGLDSASGAIPLRGGQLQVDWQRTTCEQAEVQVAAPAGSSGEVVIPWTTAPTAVTLDGQQVWADGPLLAGVASGAPEGIHVLVPLGAHTLSVQHNCAVAAQ